MNEKPFIIKIIHFLLIAIVFTVPLFFTRQFVFPFTPEKTFLFYALVEATFALWLYAVLRQKEYLPPRHPILIAGGVFLFIYTIAGVVGVSPEISFWSSISRMSGLVLLYHVGMFTVILASTVKDRRTWSKILAVAVASGVIVALISYSSHFIPGIFSIYPRSGSTIGNTSFAGAYLIFIFFLSLLLAFETTGKKRVLFGIMGGLIFFSPILFNIRGLNQIFSNPIGVLGDARAATGALWIGILITGFLLLASSSKRYLRRIGKISSVILVAFIIVSIVSFIIPGSLSRTLLEKNEIGSRFIFWESAMAGIAERPILGWGPENYYAPFYKHFDPRLFTDKFGGGSEANTDKPHNTYLEIAVTGGILSLIAYLAIFYYLLRSIVRAWRRKRLPTTHFAVLIGLTVGHLLETSFFFNTITSYIAIALILGYVVHHTSEKHASYYPKISHRVSWRTLAVALIVFLLSFHTFTYTQYWQQQKLLDTFVLPNEIEYSDLFAMTSHGRQSMLVFLAAKSFIALPEFASNKSPEDAIVYKENLTELRIAMTPYVKENTRNYRLVKLFMRTLIAEKALTDNDDLDELIEEYEPILFELSPNNPEPYWIKAQHEIFEGEISNSIDTLEKALEKWPNVSRTNKMLETIREYKQNIDAPVPLLI